MIRDGRAAPGAESFRKVVQDMAVLSSESPLRQNRTAGSILLHALLAAASLFVNGFGVYLTIRANIGAAPWDVLNLGLSRSLGILYGTASIQLKKSTALPTTTASMNMAIPMGSLSRISITRMVRDTAMDALP